jgi:hypothetical protein
MKSRTTIQTLRKLLQHLLQLLLHQRQHLLLHQRQLLLLLLLLRSK